MQAPKYYYTTRDLLMMAALAALGGIASTYINFIGDFFQSFLGFAGTTQWAAGLHVLWLVLAVGLTRKQGAGTITGILKGAVELFSGNTHGLLILLIDLVAGLLVDLGSLPFQKKDHWLTYSVAGGLAAASNVFVFQVFAALPADILTYGVIGLIALVAFISGVIFAGILGSALMATLRRSGVVKGQPVQPMGRVSLSVLLISSLLLGGGLFGYLKSGGASAEGLIISGAVSQPAVFDSNASSVKEQVVKIDQSGASVSYRGYSLRSVLQEIGLDPDYDMVLLLASDGYTFFISSQELENNPQIIFQELGERKNRSYNIIGPESKKAWVNGVVEIRAVKSTPLLIEISEKQVPFTAADWVQEMDSTGLDVGFGSKKYQGVPLILVLESTDQALTGSEVMFSNEDGTKFSLALAQIRDDDAIRIFIVLDGGTLSYALANLNGEVYLTWLDRIWVP